MRHGSLGDKLISDVTLSCETRLFVVFYKWVAGP